MGQISQNADGTYSKTYSDEEILIIQQLQVEIDTRAAADQELYTQILSVQNRVDIIEGERFSLAELQNAIAENRLRMDGAEGRLFILENTIVTDAYSKQAIDRLMVPWRVEEISQAFDTPTSEMFDTADLKDIRAGFIHYMDANIDEDQSLQFPPNAMRRYSISAYNASPVEITFNIYYADRCVVLLNDTMIATYQEDGGNFGGTQKVLKAQLVSGWNSIVFLVANETQMGGLKVSSNLVTAVERLSPLSRMAGRITGEQIQSGTLGEEHFSPDMDIVLKKIHATTTSEPAGVFGDPETYGAIQIADGVISKNKGEPLTIHSDMKVMGYIRDKDGNILDGGGGSGLSTADREKLDSIEWAAEVNQHAFSYVKLVDLPFTDEQPFLNVINAMLKMDTLRIRGDLGITFDIETVKDSEDNDVQQLLIQNSPTVFKSHLFVTEPDQDTFAIDPAEGKFQLGRGIVFVYIEGQKQSYANFYEVDEWTIRLQEQLPEGLNVLVEWQEGSPQFAKETIVSLANIPVATRTEDGLMSRFFVEDLYDHTHIMKEIKDLRVFNKIEIDDGETVHHIDAATGIDGVIKLKSGKNIRLEKLNDVIRITATGPKIAGGTKIRVAGDAENGYQIINDQRLEVTRGLKMDHIEGIDVISGPVLKENKGIDIRQIDDITYEFLNNMSLVSKGGLEVTGNAEDGYTIRNTMMIEDDPEGGIEVSGDAVRGYRITNRMPLSGEAIIVQGNARQGYHLRNDMKMYGGQGIVVEGDAVAGYTVRNDMSLVQGQGIFVEGDARIGYRIANNMIMRSLGGMRVVGDAQNGYGIQNDMPLYAGGGIEVEGNPIDGYLVKNMMSLQAAVQGSVVVTGTPTGGYMITGFWPAIQGSTGIAVDDAGEGHFTIRNAGVTSYNGQTGEVVGVGTLNKVQRGLGIDVTFMGGGDYVVWNTGVVSLIDDGVNGGIDVEDTGTNGVWRIKNTGIIKNLAGRGIEISTNPQHESTITNSGIIRNLAGVGIGVETNAIGDSTITNNGVVRLNGSDGISVNSATGDVTIYNAGVIELNAGPGISLSAQRGHCTITNAGVHRVLAGRGMLVTQSGNDYTVINNGIVDLVEGTGIDINTNATGQATVRNTGVITWNGQSGNITYTPPEPPPHRRSVAAVTEFSEYGSKDNVWMRSSQDSTMYYCWGIKAPQMTHFNVEVECGVGSYGQDFEVVLYRGSSGNVVDHMNITSVKSYQSGVSVVLRASISHIFDWAVTGIHVGVKVVNGSAYVKVNKAWLSIGMGSAADYQV